MEKEKIIKKALLKLGFAYNDNDLEEVGAGESASFLLNDVVINLLCDEEMAISLTKEELKLTERRVYDNKFEFIKPKKCLEILSPGITEINGLLYSRRNHVMLEYLKEEDLKDIDNKYERLFVIALAIEIAPTLGKENHLAKLYSEFEMEKEKHADSKVKVYRLGEMRE